MKTQHPEPDREGSAGFTLTELLAVILILAVLALPALAAVTRNKVTLQDIQCRANLKKMTVAALQIMSDTQSGIPYAGSWVRALTNYNNEVADAILCPSAPLPALNLPGTQLDGSSDKAWVSPPVDGRNYRGSYGPNGWLFDETDPYGTQVGFANHRFGTFSVIEDPERTPVFVDAMWWNLWPVATNPAVTDLYWGQKTGNVGGPSGTGGMGRCMIARHGGADARLAPRNVDTTKPLPGAINMGTADGHVENVRLEKLWTYTWHRLWQVPDSRPL